MAFSSGVDISVVVATRDRADRLRALLKSLESVDPPAGGWELVIVDNGSRDGTAALLETTRAAGRLPLVRVSEVRTGKPFALNSGVAASRGDVVAFTDDDCLVSPDWLAATMREFRDDGRLGGIGGRVELFDPADSPIATRTMPDRRTLGGPSELFGFIIGCNMAFRRNVLAAVGPFDPDFGVGASGATGEDVDLVYRVFRAGYAVRYVPTILVRHNHGRRGDAAVADARRKYALGRGAFYAKYARAGDGAVIRMAAREVLRTTLSLVGDLRVRGAVAARVGQLRALASGFWGRMRA